jgi:2-dehydro-3-deoxyphosphogluconate aldolase/(4S)-4-hydroxy-2-oxoglutarate aldolase
MKKEDVISRIRETGIIPCCRVMNPQYAHFAAETLFDAGIPILEIPMTLPEAPAVIKEITRRYPDCVVGAGTVLDEEEAQHCIDAGVRFLTSPGLLPEVVACARQAGVVVIPGAMTPTEVIHAWKSGGDFVKIFPVATAGGTHFVRALKVPLPQIPLIVTGGVNQVTAFEYIQAGAEAIGVGGDLLPPDALRLKQSQRIHELARRFLVMVREARQQLDEHKKG